MKISDAFPSAFLKADDLNGKNVTVSIQDVTLEEIGQGHNKERKMVLAFHGKEKKMILNKTNAGTIAKLYGDDTDAWIGQKITICPREVEFQGEMVLAIRVSLQKPVAAPVKAPAPKPAPIITAQAPIETFAPEGSDMDEVPF